MPPSSRKTSLALVTTVCNATPGDARQVERNVPPTSGRYHQITVLLRNQCPALDHRNVIHHQRDRFWRGGSTAGG